MMISKSGQEEHLQVFTKICKAHLFIVRFEICKEAKKSNCKTIMIMKKSNCRFLPKSAKPIFSSSAQRTKSDHLQGTPIPLQDFYISFFQTWNLSKDLQDRRFQGKKYTQKTRNFRHLLNRDKKCVNALNWDKTSKKSLFYQFILVQHQ